LKKEQGQKSDHRQLYNLVEPKRNAVGKKEPNYANVLVASKTPWFPKGA